MASIRIQQPLTSACLLVLLALVGCGGEEWGSLEGVVMLNGRPLGSGRMTLEPVGEHRGIAIGEVKDDGSYAIISPGRRAGAMAGEYRVGIYDDHDPEAAGPRPKSKFPARYADPATSGLTITIESGTNEHNFELTP